MDEEMLNKTPEPIEVHVTYRNERKRSKVGSFSLQEGDNDLIDFIANYLGTSRSEAVRSSVRAFAGHLAFLQRKSQPGRREGS